MPVVTIRARDVYLRRYGSPEAHAGYERLKNEGRVHGFDMVAIQGFDPTMTRAKGSQGRVSLTVNALLLAYAE